MRTNNIKLAFEALKIKHKIYFILMVILSVILVLVKVYNSYMLGGVFENLYNEELTSRILIYYILLLVVLGVGNFIKTFSQGRFRANTEYHYKQYTETVMSEASCTWLSSQNVGDLQTRLSQDLTQASTYLSSGIINIVSRILSILLTVIAIGVINLKIVLFLVPMMAVAFFLQITVGKPLQVKRKKIFVAIGKSTSTADEGLKNYNQIKVNSLEAWFLNKYKMSLDNIKKTYLNLFMQLVIFMGVGFLLSITPLVFILFYGAYLSSSGVITLGAYVTVATLGIPLTTTLTGLSQEIASLQGQKAALNRLSEIWDAPNEEAVFEESDKYDNCNLKDSIIQMEKIGFSYNESNALFKELNLSLNKGGKYLLVAGNGKGKSTLIKLITGQLLPNSGKIVYESCMEADSLYSLRKQIGVAEQDSYLFEDTIINNIFMNQDSITEKEMQLWFKESYFNRIFNKFPEKENTLVEEAGTNLSGGQKKCICIARALVSAEKLVILDEPLANLDAETIRVINKELQRVLKESNKTIIIITHNREKLDIGEKLETLLLEDMNNKGEEEEYAS